MNDQDQVAFSATLTDTLAETGDDSAIYRTLSQYGTPLITIAREGQQAPNGDGRLASLSTANMAMNGLGHVAFSSFLTDTSTSTNTAIWIGDGNELVNVAREGESHNGSLITSLAFDGDGNTTRTGLNDFGQVAYRASLANGDSGVFLWTPNLTWKQNFSGDWSNNYRWTLGINPQSVHDVYLDSESSVTVNGNVDATINKLQIGGGNGIATLNLQRGSTISANGGTPFWRPEFLPVRERSTRVRSEILERLWRTMSELREARVFRYLTKA